LGNRHSTIKLARALVACVFRPKVDFDF
jgi:hypothetical protein